MWGGLKRKPRMADVVYKKGLSRLETKNHKERVRDKNGGLLQGKICISVLQINFSFNYTTFLTDTFNRGGLLRGRRPTFLLFPEICLLQMFFYTLSLWSWQTGFKTNLGSVQFEMILLKLEVSQWTKIYVGYTFNIVQIDFYFIRMDILI